MKNERSSNWLLFSLIFAITVLHAVKLREQRFSGSESRKERMIALIPGASSIFHSAVEIKPGSEK